jgi:hypothetical protein
VLPDYFENLNLPTKKKGTDIEVMFPQKKDIYDI